MWAALSEGSGFRARLRYAPKIFPPEFRKFNSSFGAEKIKSIVSII
jgi:hypothetical protein